MRLFIKIIGILFISLGLSLEFNSRYFTFTIGSWQTLQTFVAEDADDDADDEDAGSAPET